MKVATIALLLLKTQPLLTTAEEELRLDMLAPPYKNMQGKWIAVK